MPNYPYQFYPTQSNAYSTQMNVGPTQSTQPTQIQNGGFVSVASEEMVASYPVAPGNCVTFKVEGQPIVLEKSMGFSQLESPRIEKYRLVKEETPEDQKQSEADSIKAELKKIWSEINAIKNRKPVTKDKNGEA